MELDLEWPLHMPHNMDSALIMTTLTYYYTSIISARTDFQEKSQSYSMVSGDLKPQQKSLIKILIFRLWGLQSVMIMSYLLIYSEN